MNINEHFILLLEKYNLNFLYKKYIYISILLTTIKDSFNWLLLYFSNIIKDNEDKIYNFTIILILILGISIPIEKYFNSIKIELIKEIKISNSNYFNNRLLNLDKQKLLNFDLIEYYNIIEHLNDNLEQYILNMKIMYDIPVKFISLIIIAINKKFNLLIILFIIFYIIIKLLNDNKNISENILTTKYFEHDNIIRNYILNSKNLLINNEINMDYLLNNINKLQNINKNISEINNNLDFKINICILIYILIVIKNRFKNISHFDFYYYFIMVYDIEYTTDKIITYYKNKYMINKMQFRLDYLNKFIPQNIYINSYFEKIKTIIIEPFINNLPLLINKNKLIINENEHILLSGASGSGKTSLLYLLKGIIKINNLTIFPPIDIINNQSYLTLSNYKSIYNGNLYDIITNFNLNPNIDLINYLLEKSKINNKLNKNIFININELSSGEKLRLLITKIMYTIKTNNYNILLFDEIDNNLNDELAIDIYKNIDEIFNDKIILYITHNEKVKKLFKKKIIIENGIIY